MARAHDEGPVLDPVPSSSVAPPAQQRRPLLAGSLYWILFLLLFFQIVHIGEKSLGRTEGRSSDPRPARRRELAYCFYGDILKQARQSGV